MAFLGLSVVLVYLGFFKGKDVMHHREMAPKSMKLETALKYLAFCCYTWIAIGLILKFIVL